MPSRLFCAENENSREPFPATMNFDSKVKYRLILLLLNTTCPVLANSVDPDQLASEEANWSGSSLFVIKLWISIKSQDQVIWLAGYKKWVWHLIFFSKARVRYISTIPTSKFLFSLAFSTGLSRIPNSSNTAFSALADLWRCLLWCFLGLSTCLNTCSLKIM